MTFRSLHLLCSMLAFSALAGTSHAQVTAPPIGGGPPMSIATFTIPQATDPGTLTVTQQAQLYTHYDGTNPGDQQGGTILGSTLSFPGLEIHGLLPIGNGSTKIIDIDLYTTYTGALSAQSFADTSVIPTAVPWTVNRIAPLPGFFQGFRFTAVSPNAVPIDDHINSGFNFALFYTQFTTSATQVDMALFNNSVFGVQGFTTIQQTPEPGTCALFGALMVSGGAAWRRRRRK